MPNLSELLADLSITELSVNHSAAASLYNEGCHRCMALLENDPLTDGRLTAETPDKIAEMTAIVDLWKTSGNQGDPNAQFLLGRIYHYGAGVEADAFEAIHWYERSAAQGCHDAIFSIANMYYKGCSATNKNIEAAIPWFVQAANQGSDKAAKCLGNICFDTQALIANKSAFDWYSEAAEKNNAQAQFKLGQMYYTGRGIEKNIETAMGLYYLSANQNNAKAQYKLAIILASGEEGVLQNHVEAHQWRRKAADNGHEAARTEMGSGRLVRRRDDDDASQAQSQSQTSIRRPRAYAFDYKENTTNENEEDESSHPRP